MLLQSTHTTSRGHYLIQELHAGSLPDLLHYRPQFLIGLLQVACAQEQYTKFLRSIFTVALLHYYVCILCVSSCVCLLPSVLILSAVLTRANSVALNITVPSLFRGMFMDTRRYMGENILISLKLKQVRFQLSAASFCWQLTVC